MTPSIQANIKPKIFWITAIAIILIAFFFRFFRLTDHPLGLTFDPAINGLDAVRLMQRGGDLPVFFPTNGGREPLHVYSLIPSIWLFGATPFAIRAVTATFSLLSVALLFAFLFNSQPSPPSPARLLLFQWERGLGGEGTTRIYRFWLAALSSLTLATSYWAIVTGRLGLRTELATFLSIPAVWFFLKGWHSQKKRWFIFSGLLLGLLGYTYSAARLLPVIILLAALPEFIPKLTHSGQRSVVSRHFLNLLLLALVAFLVYLPMLWYLYTHPAQFSARAFSVMIWNFLDTPAAIITEMARNAGRVTGFFCCRGSSNPIFGLPDYPGSHPVLIPFLLMGLAGTLVRWRSLFCRLIVIWWVVGVIPSIITIEAPHPLRMLPALVPTAILIGLGPVYFVQWITRKRPNTIPGRLLPLAIFIILYPIIDNSTAYFNDWTELQATRGAFDYGSVAIYEAVLDQPTEETPVYLPMSRLNFPTLLFYLSGHFQREAALSAPVSSAATLIASEKEADDATWVRLFNGTATILPPFTEEGQKFIQRALAENSGTPVTVADGEVAARIIQLSTDPARFVEQPAYTLNASFGPLNLTGATYPTAIDTTTELPVTLFWQANAAIKTEYDVLVRLVDDSRRVWGNGDARPTDWVYPTTFWRADIDAIAAQHTIIWEAGPPPPGRYWLAVSLFDPTTGRLRRLNDAAGESPDTVFIGPLKVPLQPDENQTQLRSHTQPIALFGQMIQLDDFTINKTVSAPGSIIELNLLWRTISAPDNDYTVFVHLLNSSGNLVAGRDSQPVENRYPTGIWSPGEQVADKHALQVPDDLPSGQYQLALGLYHQLTGQRLALRLLNGQEMADGRLTLGQTIIIE